MDLKVLEVNGALARRGIVPAASGSGEVRFADVFSAALSKGETGYDGYFDAAAARYQVPVELLKAVGKVESAFTADAVSPCGAQGIMQLMPGTARALGVEDPFDPGQNIMGGAKFIRQMLDRFDGDVSLALAAYNAGPGAVERNNGAPSYTRGYIAKVLDNVGNFSGASGNGAVVNLAGRTDIGYGQRLGESVTQFDLSSAQGFYLSPERERPALDFDFSADMDAQELEKLTDVIEKAFASGGTLSQEAVRILIGQRLFQSLEEDDEEEKFL